MKIKRKKRSLYLDFLSRLEGNLQFFVIVFRIGVSVQILDGFAGRVIVVKIDEAVAFGFVGSMVFTQGHLGNGAVRGAKAVEI